jgi:hypothetical protein
MDQTVIPSAVQASRLAQISTAYGFGASVSQGQVVYLDQNGLWQQLYNSGTQVAAGAGTVIGIAINSGSLGQPASVVTSDPQFTPGFTVVPGVIYVTSANAGMIAVAGDATTGDIPSFLMVGLQNSTTQVNFNPTFGGGVHA